VARSGVCSGKWNKTTLRSNFGTTIVAPSITENGDFDAPESARLWGLDTDDLVLTRPAHMQMQFSQFLDVLDSHHTNTANFYLEYFPLSVFPEHMKYDLGPLEFADFLDLKFNLCWIGGKTNGRLHYDRNENLMAMVKGTKTFTLYDPSQSDKLYSGVGISWSGNLKYSFNEQGIGVFQRDKSLLGIITEDSARINAMAPVNIKKPDYKKYPKLKHTRPLKCTIKPGEVLYNPSHWWHEVESVPENGISVGINYFFQPFYNRWDTTLQLEKNQHYDPIRRKGWNLKREKVKVEL